MASSFKPKKALKDLAIPLASNDLPALVSNLAPNAKNIFDRKISGNRAVRAGKGFTTFILNKDINGTIKIKKLLEDSGVLVYGVTETAKDEIKKPRRQISCTFASIFSRFFSATINSFSSKRYKWKRG